MSYSGSRFCELDDRRSYLIAYLFIDQIDVTSNVFIFHFKIISADLILLLKFFSNMSCLGSVRIAGEVLAQLGCIPQRFFSTVLISTLQSA